MRTIDVLGVAEVHPVMVGALNDLGQADYAWMYEQSRIPIYKHSSMCNLY